ncbi:MAG: HU family DNA-binding protein [Oscillospiraceae bacterium]|jgi:DNA-binding protein HU-beta|nr:HU family DNA-binding protein [Oscillospiraceae bacterium]
MTKADLINAIAEETGLAKKDSEKALNAALTAVTNGLKNGEKVQLIGFGTFEVRVRAERTGKNPRTGEPVVISATKVPAFKAGKALKDAVAQ